MLPLRARLNMGVMTIKGYSIFSQTSGLKPHHLIVKCHITKALVGGWGLTSLQRCSQCFYSPSRLSGPHTRVGWKVFLRWRLLLMTYSTNRIQTLQLIWRKYVDCKGDYVEKVASFCHIPWEYLVNLWTFRRYLSHAPPRPEFLNMPWAPSPFP